MDRSAYACVDFYQFACGGWIDKNPVPADRSTWGRFDELQERNNETLRQILENKAERVEVTPDNLGDFLGVRKFRYGMGEEEDQIGAVTGLAWTEVGGELLTIEAVTVPGKGQIRTTGKLGEVMQESIQAAMSFVKARAPAYGVKPSIFARKDIHVHLPEGAVPKDGPSAGIGMVTIFASQKAGKGLSRSAHGRRAS